MFSFTSSAVVVRAPRSVLRGLRSIGKGRLCRLADWLNWLRINFLTLTPNPSNAWFCSDIFQSKTIYELVFCSSPARFVLAMTGGSRFGHKMVAYCCLAAPSTKAQSYQGTHDHHTSYIFRHDMANSSRVCILRGVSRACKPVEGLFACRYGRGRNFSCTHQHSQEWILNSHW